MSENEDNEERTEDSSEVVSDKKRDRKQRFLNAALDITGINAIYGDVKDLLKNRDEKRRTEDGKPVDKKTRRKNVFARIVKAVNIVCKTGIFLCKCIMKVVSPGVYVIEKILEKTLVASKTAYKAMKAKSGKERAVVLADGVLQLSGVLPSAKIGGNKLQDVVNTGVTVAKAGRTVIKNKNVDGLIGATVIIGKDAFGKTAPGTLINETHEYGIQLKEELRQQADEFQKEKQKEEDSLSDNKVNENTVDQSSEKTEQKSDNDTEGLTQQAEQTPENTVQPVAESDFKTNMQSGHERLRQIREKVAARQQNSGAEISTADDAALITELRCMTPRRASVSRPQSFSVEQMLKLRELQEAGLDRRFA